MPTINNYKIKSKVIFKKKAFKKIAYRPWNIEGQDTSLISDFPKKNKIKKINGEQLVNKQESNGILKSKQTGYINNTNGEQLVNKQESNRNQTGIKQESNSILIGKQELISNYQEKIEKINFQEMKSDALQKLCGYQRKLLFYIVNQCILRGQLSSGPLTTEVLEEVISTNNHTVKTTIQRLVNKGFFIREGGKTGRGGFSNFRISESLRNAVMEALQQFNYGKQIENNWSTKQETFSSSSSSIINTITTGKTSEFFDEGDIWEDIDISPLESIKFTSSQIIQLCKMKKLSPEIVQDSINFFAFDLEHNNIASKLKSGPLNYIMGILRKGEPYLPPYNYESPRDKAMKNYILKQKELEKKRELMEKELYELAFNKWVSNLSYDQICEICPLPYAKDETSPIRNGSLRDHYSKNFWIKEKINNILENIEDK